MAYARKPEQHARKLDRIVAEAAALLAEEGPAAVLPVRVGRRINGTGYNVPNLFPNGGTLLALVLTRHLDALLEAVRQPEDWPGPPRARLAAMALAYAGVAHGEGHVAAVHAALPAAVHFLAPDDRDALATRRRWLASAFEAAIAGAVADARQDPMLARGLAAALLGMMDTSPAWPCPGLGPASLARAATAMACSRAVRAGMVDEDRSPPPTPALQVATAPRRSPPP